MKTTRRRETHVNPKGDSSAEQAKGPPICSLKNEDCSGPLQRDHVGYSSITQQEVTQQLCYYHNCVEARQLRFFVASKVLSGRPLPGPVRIRLNEWHIQYGLHPEFKSRIRELSEDNPLPEKFVPGRGQTLADKAIAEGRSTKFNWSPELRDGKIVGFWIAISGSEPRLIQ